MIQEILNSIDQIDDITTEYTVSTMNSMIDSYEKSTLILENYEGDDLSSFSIFQEGEIMDDVKKQGKGQSTLMKILSFIPRLIKAIFNKIKKAIGKGETPAAVNKELQKAPKEVKKALPILFDNKKDKKSKVSMIKKILIGAGSVGAAAIVGKNVISKSKNDSDSSSNPISKMIGLLTKLKNALKRKSETEKKLEEAKKETLPESKGVQRSNEKRSSKTPQVPQEPPVNNDQSDVHKLERRLKTENQEIEGVKTEVRKLLPEIIDKSISEESQKILNNPDRIDEEEISELIATLENNESKKDEYYKDLYKEISKIVEKCESKHKSLVSIYTTIKDCCHRVVDKCPVTLDFDYESYLRRIDESVRRLESGGYALLHIAKDGEEISLSENIGNSLAYLVASIEFAMWSIQAVLDPEYERGWKFDDSNDDFRIYISSATLSILSNADLDVSHASWKMIIDQSKKTARSSADYRNEYSVFDNSLVRKSDLKKIETHFAKIKGFVEEISKERPEEIKERNIAGVMIYVSILVELANHVFTFACGATNLVKELVGRVSEINKKYEGERNKLFNKSE